MIAAYERWKQRGRAIKESRLLLRAARRGLRLYGHRLDEKASQTVKSAVAKLDQELKNRQSDGLAAAINGLDQVLDQHLAFARKSTFREYTESIAVAVLIALFLRAFVVEAFKIPSGSMIPTLQVGDHIFVNKFIYGVRIPWTNIKFGMSHRKPRRGEVIVFIYPVDPDKDFIKRIVAVEGDTVEMRDNLLYVNGKAVERRHVEGDCLYWDIEESESRWQPRYCDPWTEVHDGAEYTTYYEQEGAPKPLSRTVVPPRSVFVMGDNRDNSSDSRVWGFVPYENIKGKAMVVWWSSGEPEGWIRPRRMFRLVR